MPQNVWEIKHLHNFLISDNLQLDPQIRLLRTLSGSRNASDKICHSPIFGRDLSLITCVMEELNLNYNEKNIGLHSKHLIKRTLVSRTEDLVRRMRWKLWHIRNPSNKDPKETFGFRTTDSPPVMVELEDFEKDLWNLVRQVKFKPAGNDLTSKIREDLNTLKNSSKIIVKGDKSRKLYQVNKDSYVKDMTDKITSNYKKGNRAQVEKVNQEAAIIAKKLDLDDRIDALQEGESFISYKDHKPHGNEQTTALNGLKVSQTKGILSSANLTSSNFTPASAKIF